MLIEPGSGGVYNTDNGVKGQIRTDKYIYSGNNFRDRYNLN